MAESADILTAPDQQVILPDLAAGCSMADMAAIDQVEDAWDVLADAGIADVTDPDHLHELHRRHQGVLRPQRRRRLHVVQRASARSSGRSSRARRCSSSPTSTSAATPPCSSWASRSTTASSATRTSRRAGSPPSELRAAKVILWKGHCSVHGRFTARVRRRACASASPASTCSCTPSAARGRHEGRPRRLDRVHHQDRRRRRRAGSAWAIGTELNLVKRLALAHPDKQIVFLDKTVCFCSTMNRIDLPHLVWALENLVDGHVVNRIEVDPDVAHWAKVALDRMLRPAGAARAARTDRVPGAPPVRRPRPVGPSRTHATEPLSRAPDGEPADRCPAPSRRSAVSRSRSWISSRLSRCCTGVPSIVVPGLAAGERVERALLEEVRPARACAGRRRRTSPASTAASAPKPRVLQRGVHRVQVGDERRQRPAGRCARPATCSRTSRRRPRPSGRRPRRAAPAPRPGRRLKTRPSGCAERDPARRFPPAGVDAPTRCRSSGRGVAGTCSSADDCCVSHREPARGVGSASQSSPRLEGFRLEQLPPRAGSESLPDERSAIARGAPHAAPRVARQQLAREQVAHAKLRARCRAAERLPRLGRTGRRCRACSR